MKQFKMAGAEQIKHLIPGIITRIAISYPFVYIDSISFLVKNKLIAACFWNHSTATEGTMQFEESGADIFPGCYIYQNTEELKCSDIEVTGRDEKGRNLLVSLPMNTFSVGLT